MCKEDRKWCPQQGEVSSEAWDPVLIDLLLDTEDTGTPTPTLHPSTHMRTLSDTLLVMRTHWTYVRS